VPIINKVSPAVFDRQAQQVDRSSLPSRDDRLLATAQDGHLSPAPRGLAGAEQDERASHVPTLRQQRIRVGRDAAVRASAVRAPLASISEVAGRVSVG